MGIALVFGGPGQGFIEHGRRCMAMLLNVGFLIHMGVCGSGLGFGLGPSRREIRRGLTSSCGGTRRLARRSRVPSFW